MNSLGLPEVGDQAGRNEVLERYTTKGTLKSQFFKVPF
jgi:hypothetical protein